MGFFDFLIDPVGATIGKKLGMPSPSDMMGGMMGGGGGGGDASGVLGGLAGGAIAGGGNKDDQNKDFDPTKFGGVPQTKFNQMRQKQLGMGGT